MVYITTVTLAATGVAQAIQSTQRSICWLALQADAANAATVYHGPSNVTSANGQAIASGGGGGSPQYPPVGATSLYDLSKIYITGTQNDIVRVMFCVN